MRWFKSKNSSFAGSFFYSTKKNNEFGMPASMVGSALINAVKVSAIPLPASMAMSAALNITRAVNMPMPASMAGSSLVTLSSFSGLLDQYPGAAAAYSIRLLRADYTGPLLELRRSSDNALKDFYPDANNEFSLSSEDGAGTTVADWVGLNDAFVRTWFDQSANYNHAIQTNSANQSLIISAGVLLTDTGKPCFNNLNYPLTELINLNDFTISWVTTKGNTTVSQSVIVGHATNGNIYAGDDVDSNGNPMVRGDTAGFLINTANGNSAAASGNETTPHIAAVYRNGISCGSKFNATNSATSNQNLTAFTINKLGYTNSFPSYNYVGNVQEVVLWDSYKDFEGIVTEQNTYFNKY